MWMEEYGKENEKIIVMLHGANFVHSFDRQYVLASEYHIIVPHIMGFGNEADRIFDTETCVKELAEYIQSLNHTGAPGVYFLASALLGHGNLL